MILQSAGLAGVGDCGVEPLGLGLCGCMGLWAGGLGGWIREMGWGEASSLATGEPALFFSFSQMLAVDEALGW